MALLLFDARAEDERVEVLRDAARPEEDEAALLEALAALRPDAGAAVPRPDTDFVAVLRLATALPALLLRAAGDALPPRPLPAVLDPIPALRDEAEALLLLLRDEAPVLLVGLFLAVSADFLTGAAAFFAGTDDFLAGADDFLPAADLDAALLRLFEVAIMLEVVIYDWVRKYKFGKGGRTKNAQRCNITCRQQLRIR